MKVFTGRILIGLATCALIMAASGCDPETVAGPETCEIRCWVTTSKYGAIAYSPDTGACGYSWDYSSRSGAENRALQECNKSDARIVAWVRNASAALAVGSRGSWAAAWSSVSLQDAKDKALAACRD